MRKTYITNMPDQAGAFLAASRVIAANGGNIVRVNYNRAVDTHTLIIEVDATPEQQELISEQLKDVQYLVDDPGMRQIILIELVLPDKPGMLLPTLEVIKRHDVNIPYINSQENGTPYQNFKMGLLVENTTEIKDLLDDLSKLCEVRVLDYEATDRILDSTIFYVTFANELREIRGLTQDQTNEALASASKVMQVLDKRHESASAAFGSIRSFAKAITARSGESFEARVTSRPLADGLTLYAIEPPFGGNTYVLEHHEALLFVDCGLGCFRHEMERVFDDLFGNFASRAKSVVLTSADVDNAGLLPLFDTIYLSRSCFENYAMERRGRQGFRGQTPSTAPFVSLTKIISGYEQPALGRCVAFGERQTEDLLECVGSLRFGDWTFQVFEGMGGHARGETVVSCDELGIIFTGDLLASDADPMPEQVEYQDMQPYLLASVDIDEALVAREADELRQRFGSHLLCPGRGPVAW